MADNELAAMETVISTYALKIQNELDELERVYQTAWLRSSLVVGKWCTGRLMACLRSLPLAETIDTIPYSLYDAEKDDMTLDEQNLIDVVVGLGNIKWWHRIIERKSFRLNGNINHYLGFMVMTNAWKLVLIEFKGDDHDNSDSKMKLE